MLVDTLFLMFGALMGSVIVLFAQSKFGMLKTSRDRIEEINQNIRELRAENAILDTIVQKANDGILIQDFNGRIEWSNPAYLRMTGFTSEEIIGRNPLEFILPEDVRPSANEIEQFHYNFSSRQLEEFENVLNVRKNGEEFWNQLSFSVAHFNEEKEPKVIVITREITEQRLHEEELKRSESRNKELAELDSLTGLPNRMKLSSHLDQVVKHAMDNGITAGVLHIDLDGFKAINDTLGHAVGDQVLVHAAYEMSRIVGDQGMVGRFGGDEFMIVFAQTEGFEPLKKTASSILAALELPFVSGDHVVRFGCSIGIAITGDHAKTENDLIKHADAALYEVKRNGRHGISCFNKVMGIVYARRMELSAQLAEAIDGQQLGVELQPQYNLERNEVHGFEALIRWYHPVYGKLPPLEFLTIAEQNGLMARVDHVAMCAALDALQQMHAAGHEYLRMSINVSTASVNHPSFVRELNDAVKSRGLKPENVTLEVLETNLLEGTGGSNLETIRQASNNGYRIELDDFGMGYAGLAHLTRITTHGVKIDRSMVRNMMLDPATLTIVRTIISLCAELGMGVVAEGIEEVEQALELKSAGCTVIQGFGIAHPMPLDQALKWLSRADMSSVINGMSLLEYQFDELRDFLEPR